MTVCLNTGKSAQNKMPRGICIMARGIFVDLIVANLIDDVLCYACYALPLWGMASLAVAAAMPTYSGQRHSPSPCEFVVLLVVCPL